MLNLKYLKRIDFRLIPILLAMMIISLLVVAANTIEDVSDLIEEPLLTPLTQKQIQWFIMGTGIFLFFAAFDYNKLREWTWILYGGMLLLLIGLFFTNPIQGVHRWYRIPVINISFQPSEYAKLIVVIALSWFLERNHSRSKDLRTALFAGLIAGVPFLLILKQPDLGTSLVLFPITLVMVYFGNLHPFFIKTMSIIGACILCLVAFIFLGVINYEDLRPYTSKILKEYQFDRLNPNTPHQRAATTAIAIGGMTGTGFRKSEFSRRGWLPAAYTDSVYPAFAEEFGFIGLTLLLGLFYALLYFSFLVSLKAKDHFGRLLSAGVTVYLAMHILVNIGMMSGILPITGVPLVLISYGGSSILSTMTALGILQSIYSRRFMF